LSSYRVVLLLYAALGLMLMFVFSKLSPVVEVVELPAARGRFGLTHSRKAVFRLFALFAVDAFAGDCRTEFGRLLVLFAIQCRAWGDWRDLLWREPFRRCLRWQRRVSRRLDSSTRWCLRVPSNILLMLVRSCHLPLAILVLLARFSISQMDVPTRQSYVMAVVEPSERSAAAGITGIARTFGAACSPLLSGLLLNAGLLSLPFFAAGGLKIVYDLALYRSFRSLKPTEEQTAYLNRQPSTEGLRVSHTGCPLNMRSNCSEICLHPGVCPKLSKPSR
jgi:hypothetical protein